MTAQRARDRKVAKFWWRIEQAAYVEDLLREFFLDCDRQWNAFALRIAETWRTPPLLKVTADVAATYEQKAFVAGDLSEANDVRIVRASPVGFSIEGIRAMRAPYE